MNICGACHEDFGSVTAFDRHRVGRHGYTHKEGLSMEPMREDGRRCLDADELLEMGWRRDRFDRWRMAARNPLWDSRDERTAAWTRN